MSGSLGALSSRKEISQDARISSLYVCLFLCMVCTHNTMLFRLKTKAKHRKEVSRCAIVLSPMQTSPHTTRDKSLSLLEPTQNNTHTQSQSTTSLLATLCVRSFGQAKEKLERSKPFFHCLTFKSDNQSVTSSKTAKQKSLSNG